MDQLAKISRNSGIVANCDNIVNTYILKRREEPLIDDISLWLHPTPPDL